MKFWTGFTIGALVSGAIVSTLDNNQQARLRATIRRAATTGRSGKIATTVSHGVGDIADVATERVAEAIDGATSKVADAIDTESVKAT